MRFASTVLCLQIHLVSIVSIALVGAESRASGAVGTTFELSGYNLAYRIDGEPGHAWFGRSTSLVDDVSGDGLKDLIVGAPGFASIPSSVYLLEHRRTSFEVLSRVDDTRRNNRLGWSVAGLSDISGDGVPDYAAGASSGEYVVWMDGGIGVVGGDVNSHPGVLHRVDDPFDTTYFGTSVASLSDGGLLESSRHGAQGLSTAALWFEQGAFGPELKLSIRADTRYRFGDPAIRNVGDLVGNDGIDDFLIASDEGGSQGRVSLVSGAIQNTGAASIGAIETMHFDGPAENTVLGDFSNVGEHPLSTAGDFTGDGVMDFVFTALRPYDRTGAAYFYDGATGEMLWELPRPSDVAQIWSMVENVGDLDGDGGTDVAITARTASFEDVVLFYNPVQKLFFGRLMGEGTADNFGYSVLNLGDLNGDGRSDFGIGAPRADFNGDDTGSFYVFTSVPEPSSAIVSVFALLAFVVGNSRRWVKRVPSTGCSKHASPPVSPHNRATGST